MIYGSKNFHNRRKNNNLEEIIKKQIVELNGTIISCESNLIKWTYVYGKQNLECKTIIFRNKIETTVKNLADILVGEGILVNKFYNSLSEKINIRKEEIPKKEYLKN